MSPHPNHGTDTQHSDSIRRAVSESQKYPPLEFENRPRVPTEQAAHYLARRPQTLRLWAMSGSSGPISCIRINGRLAWSMAEIRAALGVA